MKMAHKLWVSQERVFPHVCNFLGWIPKDRAKAETPNAEIRVAVVYGDAKSGSNFVLHQFFFLLE